MRVELKSRTRADVELLRQSLANWHSPAVFSTLVDSGRRSVSAEEFFNIPLLGFLKDAWTLAQYAQLAGADAVQLATVGENYPDGRVRFGNITQLVEVTEAIMPDRKRGKEFSIDTPRFREDPGEEWDRRLDALPNVLEDTIARKAAKRYTPTPTLLVYLNISAYGHRDREMRAAIGAVKARYVDTFAAIHVLWQQELL